MGSLKPMSTLKVALRLLLLVTLVAAAKAVADRVVPEEQFYDQATEDAHATEQAAADNTRASRGTAKTTSLKSIATLLTTLVDNIEAEQAECNEQNGKDDAKCTADQTAAKK